MFVSCNTKAFSEKWSKYRQSARLSWQIVWQMKDSTAVAVLQVVALDIEQYMKDFSEPYFKSSGLFDRIEVMVGSAQESLQQLIDKGTR